VAESARFYYAQAKPGGLFSIDRVCNGCHSGERMP
jgi:hypothetical protein